MSEQARPWWASDGPVDGGIDPDEDPVERMRAARRGGSHASAAAPPPSSDETADGSEPWLQAVAGTLARLAEAAGGAGPERGGTGAAEQGDPDRAAGDPAAATSSSRAGEHGVDVCGICPVCVGLRAVADVRPELLGHLAEAARHLSLAARSLVERPDGEREASPDERGGAPLQQIDLE